MTELGIRSRQKTFDWAEAEKLINQHSPVMAWAGLSGDWKSTAGLIWDGSRVYDEESGFLSSDWATPMIEMDIDGFDRTVFMECWVYQDDEHPHRTTWPD